MSRRYLCLAAALIIILIATVWLAFATDGEASTAPFVTLYDGRIYDVVYERSSGVMYTVSRGPHNQGTFTVMLDFNGMPRVYHP